MTILDRRGIADPHNSASCIIEYVFHLRNVGLRVRLILERNRGNDLVTEELATYVEKAANIAINRLSNQIHEKSKESGGAIENLRKIISDARLPRSVRDSAEIVIERIKKDLRSRQFVAGPKSNEKESRSDTRKATRMI